MKIYRVYSKEEKKQLVHHFWTSFDAFCVDQQYLFGKRKMWILHRTKIKNVHLRFDPERNYVQVAIEINHRNEDRRLEVFEQFMEYRSLLEEGFEGGLIWEFLYERENGKEVSRIYYEKSGLDIHRNEHWPAIFEFMASYMFILERNLEEIRDLIHS